MFQLEAPQPHKVSSADSLPVWVKAPMLAHSAEEDHPVQLMLL
jgi:hypothetical protein